VLGVNRAGGGEDVGFAIPASVVERVVPTLVQEGDYDHSFRGVKTTQVTPAIAEANNLNRTNGLLVLLTIPESPAADTLRGSNGVAIVSGKPVPVGCDVIVGIENRTVRNEGDLARLLLLETRPSDTVELTVVRDGALRTVNVTLAERPDLKGL
jgi:S1-C subfamily serine protease